MKRTLLIALPLTLAACTTPEQQAAMRQQQVEEDTLTCLSYGLRQGSEAFGNCRLQLDLARQQRYDYYYQPRYHVGFGHYHFR